MSPFPAAAWTCSCRCGRPRSAMPGPSGRAATCQGRWRTPARCSPRSPRPPSPATPGPASWSPTRCAASAPPWSKRPTSAATRSASNTRAAGPAWPPRTSPTPAASGATGNAEVIRGDARHLAGLLPPGAAGRAALVVTSPPYGPSVHGQVRAEQRTGGSGGVRKYDNRYSARPRQPRPPRPGRPARRVHRDPRRLHGAAAPRRDRRGHRPALAAPRRAGRLARRRPRRRRGAPG